MSEFDKGYILGKMESFSDNSMEQKREMELAEQIKKKLLIQIRKETNERITDF